MIVDAAFERDIVRSHHDQAAPWWESIYRQMFGPYLSIRTVEDLTLQRQGIDRYVTIMAGVRQGRRFAIEEKVVEGAYRYMALETWSNVERRTHGWINRLSSADWLVFVMKPGKVALCMPWPNLFDAWGVYGEEWCDIYRSVDTGNVVGRNRYTSRCVLVPRDELRRRVPGYREVRW